MSGRDKAEGRIRQLVRRARSVFLPRSAADSRPTDKGDVVFTQAMAITPPLPTASELINQGLRLKQSSGLKVARPYFEKAAQAEPNSHIPLFMLGNVASELGELDAAVAYYVRARDLEPNDHVLRYNLGLNQFLRGYIDAAIEELRVACRLNPSYLQAQSTYFMALLNSDKARPEAIAEAIKEWGAAFTLENAAGSMGAPPPCASHSAQLRVGFVSGDFRTHSVAHFFEPILSARNRTSFGYFLYNNSNFQDAVTERFRASTDCWRDISHLSDDAVLTLIQSDAIDILVDLSGHTAFNRLGVFARRGAPVQISYLGFPASTGITTMDYRITDVVTDPPTPADEWHCEQLLRLPFAQWCFRPFGAPAAPGPLPARTAGFVTFGSFNNLTKASDTLLGCWVEILRKLPASRLRLTRVRSKQRADEIVALFASSGVASERIECVSYAEAPPHGTQFAGVDIALDNYPYNGVTTTCETLYVGVPVISLYGTNCVSRSGLSLLGAVGLDELAVSTPERYVEVAIALGSDLSRLETLRASLRTRFEQSSLRDETRFAAEFEKLLRIAWQQYESSR